MKALFITHDGLTDPLGESQVLTYVRGLAKLGHEMHVLSCEKPLRFSEHENRIRELTKDDLIDWHPLPYCTSIPVYSQFRNYSQLLKQAKKLHRVHKFDLIHCRSYLAGMVGRNIKQLSGTPYIFDMRGFWPDERVEGKVWNLKNPVFRSIYLFFKYQEKKLLIAANHTVTLTFEAKREIWSWKLTPKNIPITVIPCCVDLNLFDPSKISKNREDLRTELGLGIDDFVLVYLGSVGTWYLLEEMLDFFKSVLKERPSAKFLFISHDNEIILNACRSRNIDPSSIIIKAGTREQVPSLVASADLGIFFIKPVYSKKASSATKCAELLAMGLPLIANEGVGDNDSLFAQSEIGLLVKSFSEENYHKAIRLIPELLKLTPENIRKTAEQNFSLAHALRQYQNVYSSIE